MTKIVIGSGGDRYEGWESLPYPTLDARKRSDWSARFGPATIDAVLAEHVFEHLTYVDALQSFTNIHEFLRPGGHFRIAVPDGNHPSKAYIDAVKPGGTGAGSDDHRVLYTIDSLSAILEMAGFQVAPREWFDPEGRFHAAAWNSDDGHIKRSRYNDPRNANGPNYTSLILDAIRPMAALPVAQEKPKLYSTGVSLSLRAKRSLDPTGQPLLWLTYGAVFCVEGFFQSVVPYPEAEVLEFGGGQSTKFLLSRSVKRLVTVETDPQFATELRDFASTMGGTDFRLIHASTSQAASSISDVDGCFDVIFVDGRNRNLCLLSSFSRLKPNGIIVFDNTDRVRYDGSMKFLASQGYLRIDFFGPSPGTGEPSITSVFFSSAETIRQLPSPSTVQSACGATIGQLEIYRQSAIPTVAG